MLSRRQLLFGAFSRKTAPPAASASSAESTATARSIVFADFCLARQDVVCRSCGESCPEQAIRFSPRLGGAAQPELIAARCTGCGECLPICPSAALSLHPTPVITSVAKEFAA